MASAYGSEAKKRPRGFLPCNPASEIVEYIEAGARLRIVGMSVDGGKAHSNVSFFNAQSKEGRIVSVLTQSGKTLMIKFADDCLQTWS